jgi:NmrA-like family
MWDGDPLILRWLRRRCRPAQIAMHLRMRSLHILLELFLLLVIEDSADLVVRLVANWPHPGQTLIARQALVLRELTPSISLTLALRYLGGMRQQLRLQRKRELGGLVKLSSLDVEQGLAIGVWHEKGEAAIRAVGIPFTFVRPTGFMSNLLAWAHSVRTEGIVRSSTADGRRPFIHSEDIAAVSIKALVGEEYAGQSLSITGPDSITFGEATAVIAEATGQPLKYQSITDEEARSDTPGSAALRRRLKLTLHCGEPFERAASPVLRTK